MVMDSISGLSRRRKIGLSGLVALIALTLVFSTQLTQGFAFMTGVDNLDIDNKRFKDVETDNGTKFWIKDSYQEEIENLTKREYYVTQKNGTEPPFQNELYDEKRKGIYVDIVSGEPLFSSKHKFKSDTGWPSFYKPLEPQNIVERPDPGPFGVRVEISSRYAGSHLGHLFESPRTPTGLRYCMNSAALEFIPADELEERGYGHYSNHFSENED